MPMCLYLWALVNKSIGNYKYKYNVHTKQEIAYQSMDYAAAREECWGDKLDESVPAPLNLFIIILHLVGESTQHS